jgi:hypothetical protein
MNKLPNRGPRVMNGISQLLSQARELRPRDSTAQAAAEHAQAQRDLTTLLERCKLAEKRVERVDFLIKEFSTQLRVLPEDHQVRKAVEKMLGHFKEGIELK